MDRCCWTSFSAVQFSGGHPSHCRPSPVLLDAFLRMSPLQVVTHPSADLARCCWTSSSVVPFPAVTHPTADRARCCLTFFFHCLLFRWSPIPVPTWTGSRKLHFRLSRFSAVTHPTADRARCCLTFVFDCLLCRRFVFSFSPIHGSTWPGSPGPVLQLSRFPGSPIPLLTESGAA